MRNRGTITTTKKYIIPNSRVVALKKLQMSYKNEQTIDGSHRRKQERLHEHRKTQKCGHRDKSQDARQRYVFG